MIGTEIELGRCDGLKDNPIFNKQKLKKSCIDCVGLQLKGTYLKPTYLSMGFESKISLADFKNGFCCRCEKTYIIAPKGIIPHNLIPKGIGLYEVDLLNYTIKPDKKISSKFTFVGIEETVKPKIILDGKFKNRNKPIENTEYQNFCKVALRNIAVRYTNDGLYKRNEIEIR